jgi:hypothetical protein
MARRALILALAVLVPATLAPAILAPGALADGDPASDVLLGQSVFYPYSPPVSAALQKSLNAQTAAAAKSGFPLKVALISSPVDLGVVPDLFNQPQKYANFLDQEISFKAKQPLLVVMPAGYGAAGINGNASSALTPLAKPAGKQSDDLAKAASGAVQALARASGHPIRGGGAGSASSGGSTALLVVLAVAALLTAGGLVFLTLRRRRAAA